MTREQSGIKIYTRFTEQSLIKEVLGVMSVNISISGLVSLVKDAKNQHNWIYLNKSAKILKHIGNFEWYYYNQTDAPWPISDRDVVAYSHLIQDSVTKVVIINVKAVPNYLPKRKQYVRVPYLKSYWEFFPVDKDHSIVKFQILMNLGGSLPPWAVNIAVDKGPFYTMLGMKKEIKKEKYRKSKLNYIMEFEN